MLIAECHLEPIENSIAPAVLRHNETVTFQCRETFVPSGPQQRVCKEGIVFPSLQTEPFVCS